MRLKLFLILFISATILSIAQQDYYNDVDLSKTGLALKEELAIKIINTHTNFLVYTPGVWEACKATDVNPENSAEVLLIYGYSESGVTARTRGINENGGNSDDWNREHVYPKSLGDPNLGTSGAGSDAHSLRPCDAITNSNRSNKKFISGTGNSGSVSGGWYPGDEWKGDVARMMMYMYLRYDTQCLPKNVAIGTTNTTDENMIDLLLEWNAEDPVSEVEEQRNSYHGNTSNTYAQGNRNPFIDNPYLATKIWGGPDAEDKWATASVEKDNLAKVTVYPNPIISNQPFFIQNSSNKEIKHLEIYSIIGHKIRSKDMNNASSTHTIAGLKQGLYLLKLSNENSVTTKKIIIK
ncbi:endonuclease [Tenacibaculum sp. SG-28]|uniref:endonuclease n=1 Tax=Tenacibaculum sp. SG-28 TaxID=754426 RepID=UPI000CF42276|nr:endonuclease [Tenacibaculum sp. SG-28]PQJ23132.1 hypothetical protein BSU00_02515 [Tenacibaculum sp. SG-28]